MCPHCLSPNTVKNGHTSYGKQNNICKTCGRQHVERTDESFIQRTIARLLLERISLRGIARAVEKTRGYVERFVYKLYAMLSLALPYKLPLNPEIDLVEIEADEMHSFVQNKDNVWWIWLAMERTTGQIVGFHIGDRSAEGAKGLWYSLPVELRKQAVFYTDNWDAYGTIIPKEKRICEKGKTNHIERFNNTLRQRNSRLVRKNLAFSKNLENHFRSILYFITDHNQAIMASL